MRGKLFKFWDSIISGFWFLPTAMAIAAVVLAALSVATSPSITDWITNRFGWEFTGGAEGASALLGMVAGSMITITGVVFSMTLVALSLTASQLGPRLLRTFMRDSVTKVVLGTFVATFLYCLVVLRTIRRPEEVTFVPHVAVSLAVVLAIVSVGVLIFFIHHVSVSIQANEVAARIGNELISGIDRLFPERTGEEGSEALPSRTDDTDLFSVADAGARSVSATEEGYLQFIDGEALLELATREDIIVRLERRPGNYVVAGSALALILPGTRLTETLVEEIREQFVLGHNRTANQDVISQVNQLVEIAVRALSPGLNDPFTATACVDRLGSALCRLATRDVPSPLRYDDRNQLRVIAPADAFPEIADAAFNQIRQYARTSAAVTIRLLDTIAVVYEFTHRHQDRATLRRHAEMIVRGAREGLPEVEDRRAVDLRYEAVLRQHLRPPGGLSAEPAVRS